MMKHKTISLFLANMALVAFPALALAGSATLHWRANTESDLAGYRIYYGAQSRSYGPYIPLGKSVISYTLNGLVDGKTYYFTLTAVDTSGNESGYSTEVSKTVSETASTSSSQTASTSSSQTASTSSNQTASTSSKMAPVLDVKVNGQVDEITVSQNTPVHVVVTLAPGDYSGQMADWWLYATAEFDGKAYEFSYVYPKTWYVGRFLSYRGAIGPVRPLDITYPKLAPAVYTLTFAVDHNADRYRDNTWSKSVQITVTP
jgi:hypothetical protein